MHSRFSVDRFSKELLEALLSETGELEISKEIRDEVRHIDVVFYPNQQISRANLGLLGKITENNVIIEPFSKQPTKTEIRSCLTKLFTLHGELQRKNKPEKAALSEDKLPQLWILATSASQSLLESVGGQMAHPEWPEGVYFLPSLLKTAIIAINQLPKTAETLWLRVMGKGATQREAISELLGLPARDEVRQKVEDLIMDWQLNKPRPNDLTEEDNELFMNLSPLYFETVNTIRQEALREGRMEGLRQGQFEGQRFLIELLLRSRFGDLDQDLLIVLQNLLQLSPESYSQVLLQLPNLSKTDLIAQFGPRDEIANDP